MMKAPTRLFYDFGEFRLDPERHRLIRDGEIVAITPKAVETLRILVERPGRLVERTELMNSVWRDVAVEDGNLTVTISMLRKALGENGGGRKFIETVPRLGYKFVAEVHTVIEDVPTLVVEKQTCAQLVIEEEIGLSRRVFALFSYLLPSSRSQKATAVASAAAVIVAVIGFAYFSSWRSGPASVGAANIRSIAVLPFKTINSGKENAHQGIGMADVLIARLSNLKAIKVRPTSAVMSFESVEEDSVSIARKLSVDAVLEGTIYSSGGKTRVTGRLIKVSDQTVLWSGVFEGVTDNEIQLQNEIALQLVDALALNLTNQEQKALTKRYTENADAYQLYLQGRYHWNKRAFADLSEAERLFRNAIDKDPNFALAYVGLADSMIFAYRGGETTSALTKALELDPNLAEAYASSGFYRTVHEWQWQEAEADFKKSIELNAGYATAHHWYAILLGIQGRNDEAKAEMFRALEINPTSYNFLADLGQIYYFNHEYDRAIEYCNKALEIYPNFAAAHGYLYQIYLRTGEFEAAINAYEKKIGTERRYANESDLETQAKRKRLDREVEIYQQGGVRKFLGFLISSNLHTTEPSVPYGFAVDYALLGDKEKALYYLEKAVEARGFMMAWVKADPVFDGLRSEPRYQAILRRMNLNS